MRIKNYLNYLRWSLESRLFERRFAQFRETGVREAADRYRLLGAFLSSGGSRLSQAASSASLINLKDAFDAEASFLGIDSESKEFSDVLASLESDGYAILPWKLDALLIDQLHHSFEKAPMTMVSDNLEVNGQAGGYEPQSPRAEKYDIDPQYFLRNPLIVQLMLDRGILSLAQEYLGSVPIIDICAAWFSFPAGRASDRAATKFHFDLDRTRWIKVFYFLSDVDEATGAHLFIRGSHRDGIIPKSILRNGYTRLTDDEVGRSFPQSDWTTIKGPAGTILMEDTRGIHKGIPLLRGHRLVLQFQYAVDLFGSEPDVKKLSPSLSHEPRFLEAHPKVLSGFSDLTRNLLPPT